MVGSCKGQVLLADPGLAKIQQGVYTSFAGLCLFDCFAASSAVASSVFFVPHASCDLCRILHIFLPPHIVLTDFLVALCRGEMPIGLGGGLQ